MWASTLWYQIVIELKYIRLIGYYYINKFIVDKLESDMSQRATNSNLKSHPTEHLFDY